jgi:hypothetical protein
VAANTQLRVEKHHVTDSEYLIMQDQQRELQRKLQLMRQKHVTLTGETYEQAVAAQRSTFGRLRAMGSSRRTNNDDNNTGLTQKTLVVVEKSGDQIRVLARPPHWVTFQK